MGIFDCDCDCAAPPNFAPVAAANAEAARIAKQAADADLAFRKQVYQESLPSVQRLRALAEQIAQQQLETSQEQLAQGKRSSDRFFREFAPIERQTIFDALGLAALSPEAQAQIVNQLTPPEERDRQNVILQAINKAIEAEANRAQDQAAAASARGKQQAIRTASRRGIDPSRLTAFSADLARAQALAEATAANQARQGIIGRGIALRSGAANLGRGLPNTAGQAVGLSLNAGNAAVANQNTGTQGILPVAQFTAGGFQPALTAAQLRQAGALGLGGLQADVFGNMVRQSIAGAGSNPLGEILGTGLGFALSRI